MRIQNLKAPQETTTAIAAAGQSNGYAHGHAGVAAAAEGHGTAQNGTAQSGTAQNGTAQNGTAQNGAGGLAERQALEIALLRARNQHLELMVETARSLMGSNQERLLRRLHEVPHEIATLSAQLRRIDPAGSW